MPRNCILYHKLSQTGHFVSKFSNLVAAILETCFQAQPWNPSWPRIRARAWNPVVMPRPGKRLNPESTGISGSHGPENGAARWRRPNSEIYSQNDHLGLVCDMMD